jgi:ATP-dependent Clp protease protease subunit
MPIGVPKVPYRLPGEEDASYVDIYNLLYRERILFLSQAVNDEISNLANSFKFMILQEEKIY